MPTESGRINIIRYNVYYLEEAPTGWFRPSVSAQRPRVARARHYTCASSGRTKNNPAVLLAEGTVELRELSRASRLPAGKNNLLLQEGREVNGRFSRVWFELSERHTEPNQRM